MIEIDKENEHKIEKLSVLSAVVQLQLLLERAIIAMEKKGPIKQDQILLDLLEKSTSAMEKTNNYYERISKFFEEKDFLLIEKNKLANQREKDFYTISSNAKEIDDLKKKNSLLEKTVRDLRIKVRELRDD
jgi:hypothetical protein